MTATGRDCGHQTRLICSCMEPRPKWAIGILKSPVHVPATVLRNYSGNQNPSCFQKQLKLNLIGNPEHYNDIYYGPVELTLKILVKPSRSGLPPTMLYKSSLLNLRGDLAPSFEGRKKILGPKFFNDLF